MKKTSLAALLIALVLALTSVCGFAEEAAESVAAEQPFERSSMWKL